MYINPFNPLDTVYTLSSVPVTAGNRIDEFTTAICSGEHQCLEHLPLKMPFFPV